MFSKGAWLRILGNSLLGVILIGVWLKFVNLNEVWQIIKTADLKIVLLFITFFITSTLLRALRLKLLLSAHKIPFKDVTMLNLLSQFLSFMIPIRIGEVAKSVYLTTQYNLPLGKTVIWVLVDRFLDFWGVLLLIATFLIFVPTAMPLKLTQTVFIVFGLFTLAFILVLKSEFWAKKITLKVSYFLPTKRIKSGFLKLTHTLIEGFEVLRRQPLEIGALILLTLLALVSDSLLWLSIFNSLGVQIALPKVVLGTSLSALTFLVPAAPGYVGSAEAAILAVFGGVIGISNNLVSAAAVLFHILTVVVLLICGVSSLYLLKFDLNLVWKQLRRQ